MIEKPAEATLIAYILGDLPEAEEAALEDAIFAEEDLFEQVQAIKEQLLDDYANNRLNANQRELFERQFLVSPWRRDRVVFAQALAEHINRPVESPAAVTATNVADNHVDVRSNWLEQIIAFFNFSNSGWRVALAASLFVALAVVAGRLYLDNQLLRLRLETLLAQEPPRPSNLPEQIVKELNRELAQERERNRQLTEQLNRQPTTPQPLPPTNDNGGDKTALFAFVLTANSLRGNGDRQTLTLPPQTREIDLIVNLNNTDKKVQAIIATTEGELIWQSQIKLSGSGKNRTAHVRLQSATVPENDYLLRISRIDGNGEIAEDLGEYLFRVIKK